MWQRDCPRSIETGRPGAAARPPFCFCSSRGLTGPCVQSPRVRSESSWTSEAPSQFCGVQNCLVFRDHFPPGFPGGIIFQAQCTLTCSQRCRLAPPGTAPDSAAHGRRPVALLLRERKSHQSCLISCCEHSHFEVHLHMKLNHVTACVGKFWPKPFSL